MLRSLDGKSVSTILGLNIILKIDVCVCVCVCNYASTLYCSRKNMFFQKVYIPPELHVCVQGDPDLTLAVFDPMQ